MSEIRHITDAEFNVEVMSSEIPVLVDFWAEWCGPCKIISPILEKLAPEFEGRIKFLKLNVDQNRTAAMKFGILSIPTLLLFKNGSVAEQMIGVPSPPKDPAEEIRNKLNTLM